MSRDSRLCIMSGIQLSCGRPIGSCPSDGRPVRTMATFVKVVVST